MYNAAAAGKTGVDLSSFQLTDTEVVMVYSDLMMSAPELFYLDAQIQFYSDSQSAASTVASVDFCYTMTAEQRQTAMNTYKKEIADIVAQVDPALSETEKALWVHDYLVSSFSYDTSMKNYDAYSLFRDRKGVCQAYSMAYVAILRELGMEAVMVPSPSMGHAWNLVKVNGNWYHVDLVEDDPIPDVLGQVLHDNFLLSDSQIRKTSELHNDWVSTITCGKELSGSLWKGVSSRMIRTNQLWYYVDPNSSALVSSGLNGEGRSTLYTFSERWKSAADSSNSWNGVFSGVSEYQGSLFINTPYEILMYDPIGKQTSVCLEAKNGERFFGSTVYKNKLEYRIAAAPDDPKASIKTVEVGSLKWNQKKPEQTSTLPFTDVSTKDSFYSAVEFVYGAGLFQGVSADRFAPYATLTRAMFVTVLGCLCGVNTDSYTGTNFFDVPLGQWYTPYVNWASENGIVNGVGNGLFNPMGELTRAQMFKMAAVFGQKMKIGKNSGTDLTKNYADGGSLADWARESVSYCAENGLLDTAKGGSLRHSDPATRAEAAQIISCLSQLKD